MEQKITECKELCIGYPNNSIKTYTNVTNITENGIWIEFDYMIDETRNIPDAKIVKNHVITKGNIIEYVV